MLEPGTQSTSPSKSQSHAAPKQAAPAPDVSLTATADQALQSVGALYTAVDNTLQRQMHQNPYATLGAAAGLGFVLGGGLASPVGQVLLRMSMRAFGPPVFNALVQNALERANLVPKPGNAE